MENKARNIVVPRSNLAMPMSMLSPMRLNWRGGGSAKLHRPEPAAWMGSVISTCCVNYCTRPKVLPPLENNVHAE